MTINVALIGLGYWGPNLARNLSRLNGAELYMLEDGAYKMMLAEAAPNGKVPADREVEVSGPRTRVVFEIPPEKLCILSLEKAPGARAQ